MRIKHGICARKRHKKILERAKGYYGARSRTYRSAIQAVIRAGQYAYRDRKIKKRTFRSLWIAKINAFAHTHGMNYSTMMHQLSQNNILLNRKILADMAMHDNEALVHILDKIKVAA